jgi:hypothetical protein
MAKKKISKADLEKYTRPLEEHQLYLVVWEDHNHTCDSTDRSLQKHSTLGTIGLFLDSDSQDMNTFVEFDYDEQAYVRHKSCFIKKNIKHLIPLEVSWKK